MNKEDIVTCQPNNLLVYPAFPNIRNAQTGFNAFQNKNINIINGTHLTKKVTKSTSIMNANRSMHPLLLPNYNQASTNTNIQSPINTTTNAIQGTNRTVPSNNVPITFNNGIFWPVNNTGNCHINSAIFSNPQPLYQQRYVASTPPQLRNMPYPSVRPFPTDTPISITKSYSILGGGDTTKRSSSFSSQNIIQLPYSPYNINEQNIVHGAPVVFKQTPLSSISPTFFDKSFSQSRKRQRLGPSCDTCRSRKVKCDAKIEILYEDDRIINEISQKLVNTLTPSEVEELSKTVLRYHVLPKELFVDNVDNSNSNGNNNNGARKHYRLLKYINKIVLFQTCSSCLKLKNHKKKTFCANKWRVEQCSFSRGLTKSDTNIFNEIRRVTGKNLDEMTVEDFRIAGLQVSFPI